MDNGLEAWSESEARRYHALRSRLFLGPREQAECDALRAKYWSASKQREALETEAREERRRVEREREQALSAVRVLELMVIILVVLAVPVLCARGWGSYQDHKRAEHDALVQEIRAAVTAELGAQKR